jgi:hypothetical protein
MQLTATPTGVPDMSKLFGLSPNVCCCYQDVTDQVTEILYVHNINLTNRVYLNQN